MIKSCDIVRRTIPDVQFLVYGSLTVDKDYVKKCVKLIEELGLGKNFIFAGYHPNPQEIYNEGDIYLLTSISEGSPYTVMEAMSCERPVVATDVGGISEIVGDYGILCQPRNPEQIAEAIIKLLNNNELRIRLGKNARDRISLQFSKRKFVKSYLDTYMDCLSNPEKRKKGEITLPSVTNLLKVISD